RTCYQRLAPISRHADGKRTSTYAAQRHGGKVKSSQDFVALLGQRADGHDARKAQARQPAERFGKRFRVFGRTSKAFGGGNVELQQHRELLSRLPRGFGERFAGARAIDALYHIEGAGDGARLVRLDVTDEVFADRRNRGELGVRLLEVVLADIGQAGSHRGSDGVGALALADADERDAGGIATDLGQFLVDGAPQRRVALSDARVHPARAFTEVLPISVRTPGRVAQ